MHTLDQNGNISQLKYVVIMIARHIYTYQKCIILIIIIIILRYILYLYIQLNKILKKSRKSIIFVRIIHEQRAMKRSTKSHRLNIKFGKTWMNLRDRFILYMYIVYVWWIITSYYIYAIFKGNSINLYRYIRRPTKIYTGRTDLVWYFHEAILIFVVPPQAPHYLELITDI